MTTTIFFVRSTLRFPYPLRFASRINARLRHKILISLDIFLALGPRLAIFVTMRSDPRNDKDAALARPRGTTSEKLRVVADTAPGASVATVAASKSDPRLVNLVRLLARQAVRDFVQAETDRRKRDRLPE
ncbi:MULTISPECIES: hypothetical protein [unclassified Bradyrhizobium]|uniref:hypothetical protein n=1 Tax=unclassified Bradyrhizobium TaxID=2631580 RepID=UPI003D1D79F7